MPDQRCSCQSGTHGHPPGDCPNSADVGSLCQFCHERAAIEAASAIPIYAVGRAQLAPLTSSASAVIALVQSLPIPKDQKAMLSEAAKKLERAGGSELNVFKALMSAPSPTIPDGFDQSISVQSFTALLNLVTNDREAKRSRRAKRIEMLIPLITLIAGWCLAKLS